MNEINSWKIIDNITNLANANFYLANQYSPQSALEPINIKGAVKYRFVNVPPIKNYPYTFKSVEKAMRCLEMHENGFVSKKMRQRRDRHIL